MKFSWTSILDDVTGYLAKGAYPLPFIYSQFLTTLDEQERKNQVCMLPFARFEMYHKRLEAKIQQRIKIQQQKRKVA